MGPSRHFAALQNLVAIGALRTSSMPHKSNPIYKYGLAEGRRGSLVLIDLFDEVLHVAQQGGDCPPLGDGFSGKAAMPEGVIVGALREKYPALGIEDADLIDLRARRPQRASQLPPPAIELP